MDNVQIQNSRSWPVRARYRPAWGSGEFLQENTGQYLNQATTTPFHILSNSFTNSKRIWFPYKADVSDFIPLLFFQNTTWQQCTWQAARITSLRAATAGPRGRTVYSVGVRPHARRDCQFKSRRGHGCLSFVSVVCSQTKISASGRSLAQRSPTECGVSECDCEASMAH
jgi:hypothetical protein